MFKSYRVMLVPNKVQESKLFSFAGTSRFAYNWALKKEMDSLELCGKILSDCELRKEFTAFKNTSEGKWLYTVSNDVTKQAIKDLVHAYFRFFKNRKKSGYVPYSKQLLAKMAKLNKKPTFYQSNGHPKFKRRKDITKYAFYQDTAKIKFTETHVKLECISGSRKKNKQKLNWVKLAEKNYIPTNVTYTNPRITYDGIHWWISVGVGLAKTKNILKKDGMGIDVGVKDLAILSDGTKYRNINKTHVVKKIEKKKRRIQRRISSSLKKGEPKTKNDFKRQKKLLQITQRLTNIRNNHIHQATAEIVKRYPSYICIEDLNIKGMMKNKHLSKAIQDQKLYMFRQVLTYKCEKVGIQVILADRFFASSKICNRCGTVKKDLKLSDRVYICNDCGYVNDRDVNAALNLRDYGLKLYSDT